MLPVTNNGFFNPYNNASPFNPFKHLVTTVPEPLKGRPSSGFGVYPKGSGVVDGGSTATTAAASQNDGTTF